MSHSQSSQQQRYHSQNDLLLKNLLQYYEKTKSLNKMLKIITGESNISLRIVDWFVTNYAKKNFTVYYLPNSTTRFKVYNDYKLKLKAYSKKRFDPFCRWERISIPYENNLLIETTIGQLNFFKWTLENGVIEYIETNYAEIEKDMNQRNSTSKRKTDLSCTSSSSLSSESMEEDGPTDQDISTHSIGSKTRKKREELSVSATKSIKKEVVEIIVNFN